MKLLEAVTAQPVWSNFFLGRSHGTSWVSSSSPVIELTVELTGKKEKSMEEYESLK